MTYLRFSLTIIILGLFIGNSSGQSILANWDFEDESKRILTDSTENIKDYTPDQGSGQLELIGGAVLSNWLASGNYANGKRWHPEDTAKYWQVSTSTFGFEKIRISSKQSGTNTGPRDFMLQYFHPDSAKWTNISQDTIQINNSWSSGKIDTLLLPEKCNNLDTLRIRWLMISERRISGDDPVGTTGTNRIDDILITGDSIHTKDSTHSCIYPSMYIYERQSNDTLKMKIKLSSSDDSIYHISYDSITLEAGVEGDYAVSDSTLFLQKEFLNSHLTSNEDSIMLSIIFALGDTSEVVIYAKNPIMGKAHTAYRPAPIVYPNPGNGLFTIEGSVQQESASLALYTASGRLLLSLYSKSLTQQLDLRHYEPGIYILRLNEGKNLFTKKIIIE